jgi:transcription initiation factor TFIID subunit 1
MMRGGVTLNPMRNEKDLQPLEPDSKFVLIEYVEERPPLLSQRGMASRLINWWKPLNPGPAAAAVAAAVNESRLSAGSSGRKQHAFGSSSGSSSGSSDGDRPKPFAYGETRALQILEESPFLGEIKPGSCLQSICNELYRAPIVEHKVRATTLHCLSSALKVVTTTSTTSTSAIAFLACWCCLVLLWVCSQ